MGMAEMDITKTYAQAVLRHSVKTNADRIRSMSDEELAEWIEYIYAGCDHNDSRRKWWLNWLKREVDSDPT